MVIRTLMISKVENSPFLGCLLSMYYIIFIPFFCSTCIGDCIGNVSNYSSSYSVNWKEPLSSGLCPTHMNSLKFFDTAVMRFWLVMTSIFEGLFSPALCITQAAQTTAVKAADEDLHLSFFGLGNKSEESIIFLALQQEGTTSWLMWWKRRNYYCSCLLGRKKRSSSPIVIRESLH